MLDSDEPQFGWLGRRPPTSVGRTLVPVAEQDNVCHIYLDESLIGAGRRSARLVSADGGEHTLWFEVSGTELSDSPGADPFLLGSWVWWMQQGAHVHVHGSVSRRLLAGLSEVQDAWVRWRPETYSAVTVTADEVRPDGERNVAAVAAFSGGVDSNYTVRRHLTGDAGWRTADLQAVVLVHGFDVPLVDVGAFDNATRRAGLMLAGSGLEILTVRTNFRELSQQWEDSFALGLAACFALLAPRFGVGLLGSSKPYNDLLLPWGSNPITDPLASTGDVEIRHDGAGATRTDKVAYLAAWPEVTSSLRVCWEGEVLDGNCGTCEKCVRTKLNFGAAGLPVPACFPDSLPASTEHLWVTHAPVLSEWIALRRHAQDMGEHEIATMAGTVIRRSAPIAAIYRHPRLVRIGRQGKRMLSRVKPVPA